MSGNPYFKSVLWLLGFGGMGYGLMLLTEPNAEKIDRIKASASGSTKLSADDQKKALFMKKLQEAATTSTPLYRPQPQGNKTDS
ncbi:uncharacterized protein Dana_GF19705 [Drosophila ananassae]|uniref:Uncharacterized protein n=1 Tax=Drosophila ananassae TaxID=7217 RepID=B3MJB0_DROAN|nr:uncharacterized protein LOC6502453 [Drosophila ananassae]EDV31320.1 uncharacterized protein Dana_GF19705 [Drosophila ananassae]